MENKWLVLGGFAFIFVIFLTSCSGRSNGATGAVVIDPNDPCSAFEGSERDNCFLEKLKCSSIVSGTVRDSCVAELAIRKGDPTVCDLVSSDQTKGFCQFQLANTTVDIAQCASVTTEYWQDNCHMNFALKLHTEEGCAKVQNLPQRLQCFKELAILTNNPEWCEVLEETEEGRCIYTIAKNTKNENICSLLKTLLRQEACLSKLAKLKNDPTLCERITLNILKDNCRGYFPKK